MTASNVVTPPTSYKCLAPTLLAPISPIDDCQWEYMHQERFPMAEKLHALKVKTLGQIGLRTGC
jgi:hypothetical protein